MSCWASAAAAGSMLTAHFASVGRAEWGLAAFVAVLFYTVYVAAALRLAPKRGIEALKRLSRRFTVAAPVLATLAAHAALLLANVEAAASPLSLLYYPFAAALGYTIFKFAVEPVVFNVAA